MLAISSKSARLVATMSHSFYNQTHEKYSQICFDGNAVLCVQEKSWYRVPHPVLPFQAL